MGVSKSLPDFLSDGAALQPDENGQVGQSPERESDRLRRELEIVRRQLIESNRRSENLQRQLDLSKDRERDYTQNLAKALEQVEDNLSISNVRQRDIYCITLYLSFHFKQRRAAAAESTVTKLKQEVNRLSVRVSALFFS